MHDDLVRKEVFLARKERLYGKVILPQSVGTVAYTALLSLIAFIIFMLLFLGEFNETRSVLGYLVPKEGSVGIRPSKPGTIGYLFVKNGDVVKKNQQLAIIMDAAASRHSGDRVGHQNLQEVQKQISLLKDLLEANKNLQSLQTNRLINKKQEETSKQSELTKQLNLQKEITASNERSFRQAEELLDNGYISKVEAERRREIWLQAQQAENILSLKITSIEAAIRDIENQIDTTPEHFAKENKTTLGQISRLLERKASIEDQREFILQSPLHGTVANLNHNTGDFVPNTQSLLTILPKNSVLEAEIFVPSRAIGFIKKGLQVDIAYSSFPKQTYGVFPGIITEIDRSIQTAKNTDIPLDLSEPFYKVTVQLQDLAKHPELQVGMLLTAKIILEKRRFVDWLFNPITKQS